MPLQFKFARGHMPCDQGGPMNRKEDYRNTASITSSQRLLLINLPYWSPLIPAMGIASLKSFLQDNGFHARAVDAAANKDFLEFYNRYFKVLREIVPPSNWGNFFNIGHEVLRNHLMAHANHYDLNPPGSSQDDTQYLELVRQLVYYTYYSHANETQIAQLNQVLSELLDSLAAFTRTLVEEEKPTVLGLSVSSGGLPAATFVFRYVRRHFPHIKTLMGGSVFFNQLATGNPDHQFYLDKTASYIDKIFIGKGEILFLKYLKGELDPKQRVFALNEDVNQKEQETYKIDIPDLSDYNLQDYYYLAASSSSSCPFNCSFCNSRTFFGEFSKKDPCRVVHEIDHLQKKHGHKSFFMTDSLLNPTITDLSNELIKADITAYMDGYFMVDNASGKIDNTMLWRKGGFYRARLGSESGSQKILDLIGKECTPEMTKATLYSLAYAGIKTTTYWVVGHPGETEEDFQMTLDLIEECRNDIWQAECNPFTYYYFGQTKSDSWADSRMLLYPKEARELLLSQTWILDTEPSREEIFKRVFRFVQHCNKLGIPNPYTADELYKADERWKKLHKNAVPSLIELADNTFHMDERKQVKMLSSLQPMEQEDGDFGF
jgi:radical SAM superfamily enzyme YgiQ (UPF0313 family)